MSHLLKRTKKSCLKLLRKISTSKQLFAQKLEEDDISTCNITPPCSFDEEIEKPHELQLDLTAVQAAEIESDVISQQLSFDDAQMHNTNVPSLTLTSKFFLGADGYEFQRLEQLRSDVASEVLEFDPEFISSIEFEKVPYKENVRYFRHTPSSSSLDLHTKNETSTETLRQLIPTSNNYNKLCNNLNVHNKNNNNNNNNHYSSSNNNKNNNTNNINTNDGLQYYVYGTPSRVMRPCPAYNVSLSSKFDGSYHNVVITEQNCNQTGKSTPIIKWDINGNSMDDDDFFVTTNNRWDDFDSRWNQLQDKNLLKLNANNSQLSSQQSSSCTLETWIDDENLENCVLNEKVLHNCNLCLKSL